MENNYYQKLLEQIDLLIQQENYQEAKKTVDEELARPYVPRDVLTVLQDHHDNLDVLLKKEKPLIMVNPDNLYGMLMSDSQKALSAIRSLKYANIRNYLFQIAGILKDSEIPHLIKVLLLEEMISQKVEDPFEFERGGKTVTVVPELLPLVADQPVFNEVMEALDKLLDKNPSFLQQAQILALNLAYDMFPALLERERVNIYTYSIIRYLYRCYDENEQWNQFAASQDVDESELMELSF